MTVRPIRSLVLTLFSVVLICACSKGNSGGDSTTPLPANFAKGADVGWITEMEAEGRKFYSKDGVATEGIALLKSLGMNTIRLRVWVNPNPAWNGQADVVAKAVRAKNLGMRVMIDFHYSDSWADPGQQTKPAAWAGLNFTDLNTALGRHTIDVLQALKAAGVSPEWVQVGNETNDGMLWPDGRASTQMVNYTQLVNTGYSAVKAVFPQAKVIVHVSNGWDLNLFTWNIGGLINNGAQFDVVGMSLYPTVTDWGARNAQCLATMKEMVARYNKDVMIVEAGMPWDSPLESKAFLEDLIRKTASVPGGRGLGVLYWEPLAYANWKGYTLGAFDNGGKPTAAMEAFK